MKFCESFDLAMAASVNQDDLLEVLENEEGDTNSGESGEEDETTKLMGMGISYSVHRNCKGNLASDKNKRLLLLSLFILPLVRRIWVQLLQIE